MEVYMIKNKINGKVYIGSTKYTKETRWGDLSNKTSHISCMLANSDMPLYNDMRDYGIEAFELSTLEEITNLSEKELRVREDQWLSKYIKSNGTSLLYNQRYPDSEKFILDIDLAKTSMDKILITKDNLNVEGMTFSYYTFNGNKFNQLPDMADFIQGNTDYSISYTQLKYIIAHRTIPRDLLIRYPNIIYTDNVSGLPTRYPDLTKNPSENKDYGPDYNIDITINYDNISIKIIQLVNENGDMVGSAYQYNEDYYPSVKQLYDELTKNGYLMKYGELRWILANIRIPDKMKLRFPNLSISTEKKIKINARTVKYASDFEVLSKKGHHTLSTQSLESKEIEFKPSEDKFDIVRLSEDNYSLNGEELGISDELLKKLNILGVDITRPQFRMIIGHKRIPKSLLENYPNMTYISNI